MVKAVNRSWAHYEQTDGRAVKSGYCHTDDKWFTPSYGAARASQQENATGKEMGEVSEIRMPSRTTREMLSKRVPHPSGFTSAGFENPTHSLSKAWAAGGCTFERASHLLLLLLGRALRLLAGFAVQVLAAQAGLTAKLRNSQAGQPPSPRAPEPRGPPAPSPWAPPPDPRELPTAQTGVQTSLPS